jgi:hypothetical protein
MNGKSKNQSRRINPNGSFATKSVNQKLLPKYNKQKSINLQFAGRAQPCAAADLACGQEVRRRNFSKSRKIRQVTWNSVRPAKPLSAVRWAFYDT